MKKILIVLLASLIGMLLCCGVALAGNCCSCYPTSHGPGDPCKCIDTSNQLICEGTYKGIWVGHGNCVSNSNCSGCYCDDQDKCVPEITTIALLATGLICMAGYFRHRRKEE